MAREEQRRAFITGVSGQDGWFLAELLASRGYEVHGFARRDARVPEGVLAHRGDLLDSAALLHALEVSRPHEVYNLGAQSNVGASFVDPRHTFQVNVLPVQTILGYARHARDCRVYQASTSEMFGNVPPPQHEDSPFNPQSPYAISKVTAHQLVKLERESRGTFCACGVLFNHESRRRPTSFVTRKVTQAAVKIALGLQDKLALGTLDTSRDWGDAEDYVVAMHAMLQQRVPRDYVIATGVSHTVRDLVEEAFRCAGELAGRSLVWREHVVVDSAFARPADVQHLRGDASRARAELGWEPRTTFAGLVRKMVEHDFKELSR